MRKKFFKLTAVLLSSGMILLAAANAFAMEISDEAGAFGTACELADEDLAVNASKDVSDPVNISSVLSKADDAKFGERDTSSKEQKAEDIKAEKSKAEDIKSKEQKTEDIKSGKLENIDLNKKELESEYSTIKIQEAVSVDDGKYDITNSNAKINVSAFREVFLNDPDNTLTDELEETTVYENKIVAVKEDGSSYGMFQIEKSAVTLNEDGTYYAEINVSKKTMNGIYFGKAEDEEKTLNVSGIESENGLVFGFNVPSDYFGYYIPVVFYNGNKNKWGETTYYLGFKSLVDDSIKFRDETTDPDPDPGKDPDPGTDPEPGTKLEDGKYLAQAATDSKMFKITSAALEVKDGRMTAVVTLSGKGYDYLFMGSAAEAFASCEDKWIPAVIDKDGKYTYEITVPAIDKEFSIAARSKSKAEAGEGEKAWYDRKVTILSEGIEKIKEETGGSDKEPDKPEPTPIPTPDPDPSDNNKTDNESDHVTDNSGSTSFVDNSSKLNDGVYTPDIFNYSGGTNRVRISCSKINIIDGKAYATIVFSSSNYEYVKASGSIYYPQYVNGTSVFTIPVELNQNNRIIGMTSAMSQMHEIEYSIFVYLKAADTASTGGSFISSGAMDDKAPEIAGLKFEAETKIDHAEHFKIFNYENDIVLLEIDMSVVSDEDDKDGKKEQLDPDDIDKESETDIHTDIEAESEADENEETNTDTDSDEKIMSELYLKEAVKYLIVPENMEIPVGLDKDVIVIRRPKEEKFNAYLSSIEAFKTIKDIEEDDNIKSVGFSEQECIDNDIEVVESAKTENNKDSSKVIFAGTQEEPDYKELVKTKAKLAIFSCGILPGHDEKDHLADGKISETKDIDEDKNKDNDKKDKAETLYKDKPYDEQKEIFGKTVEKLAMLGIPVIVDRSADEKTEIARAEWIKVYGAVFGQTEKAEKLFDVKMAEFEADKR